GPHRMGGADGQIEHEALQGTVGLGRAVHLLGRDIGELFGSDEVGLGRSGAGSVVVVEGHPTAPHLRGTGEVERSGQFDAGLCAWSRGVPGAGIADMSPWWSAALKVAGESIARHVRTVADIPHKCLRHPLHRVTSAGVSVESAPSSVSAVPDERAETIRRRISSTTLTARARPMPVCTTKSG